jgi:hypothetical protein
LGTAIANHFKKQPTPFLEDKMKLMLATATMALCVNAQAAPSSFEKLQTLFDGAKAPANREELFAKVKSVESCAFAKMKSTLPEKIRVPNEVNWTESSGLGPEFPPIHKKAILFFPPNTESPDEYEEKLDSQGLHIYAKDTHSSCNDDDGCTNWTLTSNVMFRITKDYLIFHGQKDSRSTDVYYGYCWK